MHPPLPSSGEFLEAPKAPKKFFCLNNLASKAPEKIFSAAEGPEEKLAQYFEGGGVCQEIDCGRKALVHLIHSHLHVLQKGQQTLLAPAAKPKILRWLQRRMLPLGAQQLGGGGGGGAEVSNPFLSHVGNSVCGCVGGLNRLPTSPPL